MTKAFSKFWKNKEEILKMISFVSLPFEEIACCWNQQEKPASTKFYLFLHDISICS